MSGHSFSPKKEIKNPCGPRLTLPGVSNPFSTQHRQSRCIINCENFSFFLNSIQDELIVKVPSIATERPPLIDQEDSLYEDFAEFLGVSCVKGRTPRIFPVNEKKMKSFRGAKGSHRIVFR